MECRGLIPSLPLRQIDVCTTYHTTNEPWPYDYDFAVGQTRSPTRNSKAQYSHEQSVLHTFVYVYNYRHS
jgi:hypothetical protein